MTVVRIGGRKPPDKGAPKAGRILRVLPLVLRLGLPTAAVVSEVGWNAGTRSLEYVCGERREVDPKRYRGSFDVDPNRPVQVYDNGVVLFTKDGWVAKYIDHGLDGEVDGSPDIYIVSPDKAMGTYEHHYWYRGKGLFEHLVRRNNWHRGVLVFPSSNIDVIEDGSEITRTIDADYTWLRQNGTDIANLNFRSGQRPDRTLPLPDIYIWQSLSGPPQEIQSQGRY